jgi:hypothetical protein
VTTTLNNTKKPLNLINSEKTEKIKNDIWYKKEKNKIFLKIKNIYSNILFHINDFSIYIIILI